ncbi:hypothetical protein [Comamonas thiooxydans]|uniref:hypothetical protein n=1 Tax=Comamonas thiooxydans TaxID=363952 RepID=UPI000B41FA59|nr:hypothetical protein [Comamonas thiooxydans]
MKNKFLAHVKTAVDANLGTLVEMVVAMLVSTLLFLALMAVTAVGVVLTGYLVKAVGITGFLYTLIGWLKVMLFVIEGIVLLGVQGLHAFHYLKKMVAHH